MSNILNDRIIDDQGNARTVANGQDARLSYIDVFGNRKQYLLEGEGGGDVKVPTKTSELQNDSGFITADDIPDADVDLSNYVTQGNINFTTTDADGNLTNKFSQQAGYTQIGMTNTNLVDFYGNYLKWYQQNNQSYPQYGVDFSSATEFKLPANTTVNGNKIIPIYQDNAINNAYLPTYLLNNTHIRFTKTLTGLRLIVTDSYYDSYGENSSVVFTTGDTFTYTINMHADTYINKPFNFQANKTYIIAFDNKCCVWAELTTQGE